MRAVRFVRQRVLVHHDGGTTDVVAFRPFVWATEDGVRALRRIYGRVPVTPLAGDGPYRFRVRLPEMPRERIEGVYVIRSPETQFLISRRARLAIEAPRVVAFDLEVASDGFPNPDRDPITLIAVDDHVMVEDDERDLLVRFMTYVRDRDPDIVIGHNLLGFDLPYVVRRCQVHGLDPLLGRGCPVHLRPSRRRFAERTLEFQRPRESGRAFVDTMHLVAAYDVHARELSSYGLKAAASYFGVAAADRTYLDPSRMRQLWRTDRDRVIAYALDDVRETRALYDLLGAHYVHVASLAPMTLQAASLASAGVLWEAILLEHYVDHALPEPAPVRPYEGAYVDAFVSGRFAPAVAADVTSLYPNIMLTFGCHPRHDVLGVHRRVLAQVLDERVRLKAEARRTKSTDLRAREQALKLVANSAYGVMALRGFPMADVDAAAAVTRHGRQIMQTIVETLRACGAVPLVCDTDGVVFVPPPEGAAVLEAVNARLPERIRVGVDGVFRAALVVGRKHYALLGEDGRVIVKGSGLRSRGLEPFIAEYITRQLRLALEGDLDAMVEEHRRVLDLILSKRLSVEAATVRKQLSERTPEYLRRLARGGVVEYVVCGDSVKTAGRRPEEAAPRDLSSAWYVRRLMRAAARFASVVRLPAPHEPLSLFG